MVSGQDKEQEKRFYDEMFTKMGGDAIFITHGYEEIYQKTVDRSPGGLALDVGCAAGKHSINLDKKGFRTVALDLSLTGVRTAKANAEKAGADIQFVVCDAEHMPFKNGVFDVVFCALLLHHFTDLTVVSKELSRIAGGHLFALDTNALEPMTFFKFNVLNPILKPSFMTPNQRALYPGRLRRIFEKHGFSQFEFSWIDIHVPYAGITGWLTKIYAGLTKILPTKNRCNKFVMSCVKAEHRQSEGER
jgi:SAM-dependent methyltransferase